MLEANCARSLRPRASARPAFVGLETSAVARDDRSGISTLDSALSCFCFHGCCSRAPRRPWIRRSKCGSSITPAGPRAKVRPRTSTHWPRQPMAPSGWGRPPALPLRRRSLRSLQPAAGRGPFAARHLERLRSCVRRTMDRGSPGRRPRPPGGHVTSYGTDDGLPVGSVLALAKDLDGRVWAGTSNGLYALDGTRWRRIGAERAFGAQYVSGLLVDEQGALWAAGVEGTFKLARGATLFEKVLDGGRGFAILAPGPDRSPGWRSRSEDCRRCSQPTGPSMPAASTKRRTRSRHSSSTMTAACGGALGGTLVRVPAGRELAGPGRARALADLQRFRPGKDRTGENIWVLLEDREGNVWVGSTGGLDRLRNVRMRPALGPAGPVAGRGPGRRAGRRRLGRERARRPDRLHPRRVRVRSRARRDGRSRATTSMAKRRTGWAAWAR
jgi:hypothetical protein